MRTYNIRTCSTHTPYRHTPYFFYFLVPLLLSCTYFTLFCFFYSIVLTLLCCTSTLLYFFYSSELSPHAHPWHTAHYIYYLIVLLSDGFAGGQHGVYAASIQRKVSIPQRTEETNNIFSSKR